MDDPLLQAPIECPVMHVIEDWIDYNGHMNMAYYMLAFDRCLDYVYDEIGIGADYVKLHGGSCFTREVQVNYIQELVVGDPIRVTLQLLDCDEKRLHFIQEMHHHEEGYLAATAEQLALHVDMNERRTAPFPEAARKTLTQILARHRELPTPAQVGQTIGIRRR